MGSANNAGLNGPFDGRQDAPSSDMWGDIISAFSVDDQVISLNLVTVVALLLPLIVIFFSLMKKWKKSKAQKLPPGPPTLPIIGNMHQVASLPFRSFRDLAKQYGPIMHLKLGEIPTIVISSPEIAKQVLKDNGTNFADRPESVAAEIMWYDHTSVTFSYYGDYWKQMRKICMMELLGTKMVRSFRNIRNEEISRLIKSIHLSSGNPMNLTQKLLYTMSSIICRAAFGKVHKDNDLLIALVNEGVPLASGFMIADFFPSWKMINMVLSWPNKRRLLTARRKLEQILEDIIDEHKQNQAKMEVQSGGEYEGFVDVLLRIKENGGLQFPIGNEHIKVLLFDMHSAATETSSITIDWIMTELIRNPRVMAKAQAEVRHVLKGSNNVEDDDLQKLKYLKLVIKETFRLHAPVPLILRASREESEINGYTIPARAKVMVNNWAIHRDPQYWANPESFEPERFENLSVDYMGGDFEYLPFGSGKRICPGMTFGLANVEPTLAQLLYNFNWKLPDGVKPEDMDMTETFGLGAQRKQNLVLVAVPYQP